MKRSGTGQPRRKKPETLRFGFVSFREPMLLCCLIFLLFWFGGGVWLRTSLLAALIHESGHILIYGLLLHKMPEIEVNLTGFCLKTSTLLLKPEKELAITVAGPALNFAAAFAISIFSEAKGAALYLYGLQWANVLIGGFNLLPIPPLDGWKALMLCRDIQLHFLQK